MNKRILLLLVALIASILTYSQTSELQKLSLGKNVSISGNFAIGGSSSEVAYIYKNVDGVWSHFATLNASDGASGDNFGCSVSISGNYAIVGASGKNAAYIFYFDGSSWIQQEKLTAYVGSIVNQFGLSVGICEDYAIVGAPSVAAVIFYNDGTSWIQQAIVKADDEETSDIFGRSVSISGDYAIIGAPWDDDKASNAGTAYIFHNNNGSWSKHTKLFAEDGAAGDNFGIAVDIFGTYAIIGAYYDDNYQTHRGSAYVFKRNNDTWAQKSKLTPNEDVENFGHSVSISNKYAVVGNNYHNYVRRNGFAFVFLNDNESWIQQEKLIASDGKDFDYFGSSVSVSDNYIIVGASSGSYIYQTPDPNITIQPKSKYACGQEKIFFSLEGRNIVDYQWQLSTDNGFIFNNILDNDTYNNANSANLDISRIIEEMHGYQYRCIVSNNFGTDTSDIAILKVLDEENPETPDLPDLIGSCSATATPPTTTDNCSGTITGTTSDPLIYNHQGTYTITWTFTDNSGNSTNALQKVIVKDETPPNYPYLYTLHGECYVEALPPTTFDNCDGEIYALQGPQIIQNYWGETHEYIYWSFRDNAGNMTHATQDVFLRDITKPEIPVLPDLVGECSVIATPPTTQDNCAGTITGTTSDPLEYTEQGEYTITWTFRDRNNNSVIAEQKVIVNDVTNPETPILPDLIGECTVTSTPPTTNDECAGIITGITSDPLVYTEQGEYYITWTFDDSNGNSINVDQKVIVNDVTNPEAPSLPDLIGECSVIAIPPTTNDECVGIITGTTSDPLEYTEQGEYYISWTFDDGHGNNTIADQKVIIDDSTPPIQITLPDLTDECYIYAETPTTSDNCSGTIAGTTTSPIEYSEQGEYKIIWNFNDGHGNSINVEQNVKI
jgi:hypothetical protein